ncbi:4'-phosphopantetheinyl transferase family protein [Aspergillus puulaauensis]|uniref:holo-[acyl-carrier-protein] synthase n=1 Tax=Aspergillus puulaauensis TaxID=1220207 RepID=A0A7R7XRI3_9EURO|nr:uncharacterized protein APUU_51071A [Aspergillus puulaauensis]BCS26360.1 hypothetical protein APUU_51071A [Aspergillus puulaauensis]
MAKDTRNPPTLTRWYIDTRPLTLSTTTLPLLTTLQEPDQTAVQKFYHLKDRHMSLASNLLKYLYIHRTCRVPWSSVVISRTPDPHRRPCFIPDPSKLSGSDAVVNVEFNVSHQASMVAIAGTTIPTNPDSSPDSTSRKPEVGIDITCVNERQGRAGEERTLAALYSYVDIFSEVFSAREIAEMKRLPGAPSNTTSNGSVNARAEYGYRLFYTYWALKEAYIKMTGEALLASWLRELEFNDVIAPSPAPTAESGDGKFGEPYTGVRTTLKRDVVEDVRVEVVALENDFLFATAARGGGLGAGSRPGGEEGEGGSESADQDPWMPFEKLDIERDIRPCATGVCNCLS